jgi:polysaccharide biosynthesis transport protein
MHELSPYRVRRPLYPPTTEHVDHSDPVERPANEPSLRDYWLVIRKHRWIIAAVLVGVIVTAGAMTTFMTRMYTAETVLLVDPRAPQVVDIKQVIAEPQRLEERDFYITQFEMVKSRSLAAEVIFREKLSEHPFYKEELELSNTEGNPNEPNPKLIDFYLGHILRVTPLKNSRLVKIEITTPDPELSARLANAHGQAYIGQGLNFRTSANRDALDFLEGKLGQLKERVQTAEAALNSFRRQKGIVSLDEKENIIVDRLADLNKRLTEAEVERIGLESQVILIKKRAYESVPAVVSNLLIQTLKAQLSRLEADYANLSTQFTNEYPQMIQMNAQLDETRRRLHSEVGRVAGSIESAFLSAVAKERKLRDTMEQQKNETLGLKDASVEYAVLAREADTNRQLYDSVLQRIKEIGVAAELRASNVFIVDRATPPFKPSKPNVLLYLAASGLIGLAGGLGAAFLKEYFDNTLKTPEEVEQYLNLPNLAAVPEFPSTDRRNLLPDNNQNHLATVDQPYSSVTEAYSMLHTSIKFSRAGDAPTSILFTSGIPGEGKTVTAINTAIVFARMGASVVLIDADLRNPKCHEVLGVKNSPGLTEVITGQREIQEVTQFTSVRLLHFIPSGSTPPRAPALLGSRKMQEIIESLRHSYDLLVFDSPPIMPVTDAVLLSASVEGVILVVDSRATPNRVVKEAHARLQYAKAKILGVVLNKVDIDGPEFSYCGYSATDYAQRA